MNWNICVYCGKFVSYDDLIEEIAVNIQVTPDSEFTRETYECYHIKCHEKHNSITKQENIMLFEPQYKKYEGEDRSELIGDEWMSCWCDCPVECEQCSCQEG